MKFYYKNFDMDSFTLMLDFDTEVYLKSQVKEL